MILKYIKIIIVNYENGNKNDGDGVSVGPQLRHAEIMIKKN